MFTSRKVKLKVTQYLGISWVEVRELGDESVKLMFWIDVLYPYVLKTRSFLVWLKIATKF